MNDNDEATPIMNFSLLVTKMNPMNAPFIAKPRKMVIKISALFAENLIMFVRFSIFKIRRFSLRKLELQRFLLKK